MVFEDLNDELSDYIKLLRFKSKKSQEEVANDFLQILHRKVY